MRCGGITVVALLTAWITSAGQAATIWDESIAGDISNDRLQPTAVILEAGDNQVLGSVRAGELDYLTVTVSESLELSQLILEEYVGNDGRAFIAVQAGTSFTESPSGTNTANLLGWTHFGRSEGDIGMDVLDDLSLGSGAQGFERPLPAGDYTFWIQQTGAMTDYTFNFLTEMLPTASLPGDFNADGAVNLTDFNILKSNFGASDATPSMGDADGDGQINLNDFNILKANFGTSSEPVPEPATLVFAFSAVFVFLSARAINCAVREL